MAKVDRRVQDVIERVERRDRALAERDEAWRAARTWHYVKMAAGGGAGCFVLALLAAFILGGGVGSVILLTLSGAVAGVAVALLNVGPLIGAALVSVICVGMLTLLALSGALTLFMAFPGPLILCVMVPAFPVIGTVLGFMQDAWDSGTLEL